MLYQLFFMPLELIYSFGYGVAYNLLGNPGLSIVVLSLIVNICLLPLYKRADAIQEEEKETENRLRPWVDHIKKHFHGDQRYMMLQTYYRQNGYRPYYALRGTITLALEIPFFIAAYRFLSGLEVLQTASFGPIRDLGAPDGLLQINGIAINLLPIVMTLINFVSSFIYTKGAPVKGKIQLYGIAAIFLILLYNSPSGLVFYWTLNNLFSLIKNLFAKLKNPKKVLTILLGVFGIVLVVYAVCFFETGNLKHKAFIVALGVLCELPIVWGKMKNRLHLSLKLPAFENNYRLFFISCIALILLTGVLIPSSVIKASPAEFVLATQFFSPVRHILYALLLAAGLFGVWLNVFYFLSGKSGKRVLELGAGVTAGVAVIDYMFFGTNLGLLTSTLQYESKMRFSSLERFGNIAVVALAAVAIVALFAYKKQLLRTVFLALSIAIFGMSAINIFSINSAMVGVEKAVKSSSSEEAHFTVSQNGKNVVVIFLDRAVSSYFPYLLEENEYLQEALDGFVYYPNTVSFSSQTNISSPAIYGGYEYTPEEINKRSDEKLVDKHNESLKVMPYLFCENDFDVTVCDPPYAGYQWIPDLTVFSDHPEIDTFVIDQGQYSIFSEQDRNGSKIQMWERNFFCFSLMKISPIILQPHIYQGGYYYDFDASEQNSQVMEGLSKARGYSQTFMTSYSSLDALRGITSFSSKENGTYLSLYNNITHAPMLLQEPEYTPERVVDNREYDAEHAYRTAEGLPDIKLSTKDQVQHYHINMAAMIQLGKWFDCLRENNAYDNTRIIIVADHGYCLNQFEEWTLSDGEYDPQEDLMYYNPLLLVKDYDSKGFRTDRTFMTIADVPSIAMEGVIENPTNPFTGKLINQDRKEEGVQYISGSDIWDVNTNNGNTFLPGPWYSVHDDVFDVRNWEKLDVH